MSNFKVSNEDIIDQFPRIDVIDDFNPATAQPVVDKDGNNKLVRGRITYRIGEVKVKDSAGNKVNNVSIRVFTLPSDVIEEYSTIELIGDCIVQPWVGNTGRLGYTITAESIRVAGQK